MERVIITGGNEGIGYYMVKEFLEEGKLVGVLDIQLNQLEGLKEAYKDRLLLCKCNVANKQEMDESIAYLINQFKGIDIAIHNACKCLFLSLEETTEEEYKKVFDVNYFGGVHLARAVLPTMKQQKRGKICFTSSGVGVMGFTHISAYASSKGAIESLAKCLKVEYRNTGVSFHIFHPPLTRTRSAKPLPIPEEMKVEPEIVGRELAKSIHKKSFIICHSFGQKMQTKMAYWLTYRLGEMMSKMTEDYKR